MADKETHRSNTVKSVLSKRIYDKELGKTYELNTANLLTHKYTKRPKKLPLFHTRKNISPTTDRTALFCLSMLSVKNDFHFSSDVDFIVAFVHSQ